MVIRNITPNLVLQGRHFINRMCNLRQKIAMLMQVPQGRHIIATEKVSSYFGCAQQPLRDLQIRCIPHTANCASLVCG